MIFFSHFQQLKTSKITFFFKIWILFLAKLHQWKKKRVLCISLFSGQVKKLRKCSRKNPCCSEMMSCSKWIAEEIEKPGVENSPCWESHLVQWIVEESHVLFKWIAEETIVEGNPSCWRRIMSCPKWIAEEIQKPGVENSPCWESHLVQWIVEEAHVLFKWIAEETIVEGNPSCWRRIMSCPKWIAEETQKLL